MEPAKVLDLVKVDEEDDVFSFSQVNLYKTDVRSLKKNLWSLDPNKKKPTFQSQKSNLNANGNYLKIILKNSKIILKKFQVN